jgi:ribosomal protein S12 methylthiotransferase accessory factor
VVIAAAVREDDGPGALCFGAGASLDPESALRAGLAEIATDAPALSARTRAELPRLRAMAADFDQVHTVHDHSLLYGLPEMAEHVSFLFDGEPSRTMADLAAEAPLVADDLWADLRWCVDVLAGHGLEVVAVEQTLPQQRELGLHTASVLVPGLLPIDFGWQRQRAPRMPRLRTALATGPPHLVPHPFP